MIRPSSLSLSEDAETDDPPIPGHKNSIGVGKTDVYPSESVVLELFYVIFALAAPTFPAHTALR